MCEQREWDGFDQVPPGIKHFTTKCGSIRTFKMNKKNLFKKFFNSRAHFQFLFNRPAC